jgi:hypothetical protein
MRFAILFGLMTFFGCEAYAQSTLDEHGLAFDEFHKGDVVGFDEDQNPIYLGGRPELEVYRGTRSIAGEFPTSGWIGNCTANAVALDVVVTAGHCKGTGARISFAHRESGRSYSATCTRHPRYNTRTIYNDWTLCKLDEPLPTGSKLVSFVSARTPVGTDMYVNGFGAPNVGVHYWGLAKLQTPSGQDLKTCGPANLGGGDSGGTLMINSGDRTLAAGADGSGVNSRGNSSCSWYNDYAHSEFQSWAREYETAKGVKLCGISANCKEPPTPVDCPALYAELAECVVSDDPVPMPAPRGVCWDKYQEFAQCITDAK